jgi:hypothetical protein
MVVAVLCAGGGSVVGGSEIRVDPDGLTGFAAGVRSHTENGFEADALAADNPLHQRMR